MDSPRRDRRRPNRPTLSVDPLEGRALLSGGFAGLGSLVLLVAGFALDAEGSGGLRVLWLTAALTAAACLLVAIALIVPRAGLTPFWGRVLDLTEGAVLLSLIPLCLAVLDVYTRVRGLTGD